MTFTYLSSSEDREEWLRDRRSLVTATDVVTLATTGAAGWLKLKAEKSGHLKAWPGNRFTRWGNEREPAIAAVMQQKYPWLKPNSRLVQSDSDPRWGATPDMIGDAGLCQIKTDLRHGGARTEPSRGHVLQCNWELLVTGMDENILVYEPYEETEFGFRVVDPFLPPVEFSIKRDPEIIAYLLSLAEQFLAMGEPSPMDALLADYAQAEAEVKDAQARLDGVKEKILHEIGDRQAFKHVSDLGSVSLSTPKPTERLDSKRLKEALPDVYSEYTTVSQGKPRLTVKAA